jgi:hypothetical protein
VVARKKRITAKTSRRRMAANRASAPKISRSRLRSLRDELNVTRNAVTDTFHKFWIIPEQDIRQTLAATQHKIGRAVEMLRRAA